MPLFKSRRRTSRPARAVRRHGDLQKLHVKVSSPRIVMLQGLSLVKKLLKILLALALIGMICWGITLGLRHIFIDNEEYQLKEINLVTNGHIDHARLVEVTQIDLQSSIFEINTSDMQSQLKALPEVTTAHVARRLPGSLLVNLTERVPLVWIQCESLGYPGKDRSGILADQSGVTFPCEGALWKTSHNLPVIHLKKAKKNAFNHGKKMLDTETLRAIALVAAMRNASLRENWLPKEIFLLNNYSMKVLCNDGSHAIFGLYEHERQITNFVAIREHALATKRPVEHINLIPKKNIPVRFRDAPVLVKPRNKTEPTALLQPYQNTQLNHN